MSSTSGIGNQKTIEQIIASQAESTASTRNTGELGKNEFLQLLITQVQHQDPLNPASDTDFIAQMAQFSALEQMQNLNKSFAYSSGFALMGKYISADITDEATGNVKYVDGKVESVKIMNGEVYAVVGDDDVPLDKISWVFNDATGSNGNVTDYSGIIGLLGNVRVINEDGKTSSIEGIISSIDKENDGVYARLDEVEIQPYRLDIGAFENQEEYVKGMVGKAITVRFEDELTGEIFTVKGILRAGYEGNDGKLRLLLDDVKMPVGNIYSTRKIDLLSTEQMLLNEILKELQKQNSSKDPSDESSEEESDITDVI